jgi:hypothetical protein
MPQQQPRSSLNPVPTVTRIGTETLSPEQQAFAEVLGKALAAEWLKSPPHVEGSTTRKSKHDRRDK